MLTLLPPPSSVFRCGHCGTAGPGLLAISLPLLLSLLALVSWVTGEFTFPPRPCVSAPGTPYLRGPYGGFFPLGNSSTLGVSIKVGNSNPLPTPWRSPLVFSATPEASCPPSLIPTLEDSPEGSPLPSPLFYPMAASRSRCVRVLKGDLPDVSSASLYTPWYLFRASSLRFPRRHRQRLADLPHPPPAVSASSSVANPSVSYPLYSAILSALSSWNSPPTRYFLPAP